MRSTDQQGNREKMPQTGRVRRGDVLATRGRGGIDTMKVRVCEDCATEDEKQEEEEWKQDMEESSMPSPSPRVRVGLEEGQFCDRCGKVNSVGRDPDKVCGKGTQGMIVQLNGDTVKHIRKSREKKHKARSQRWWYLGPIHVTGDFHGSPLEIRKDTRIFHKELENDIQAKEVSVDAESGMTYIEFTVRGTIDPAKKLRYSYDQLVKELEDGHLKTREAINDEAEDALQQLRAQREEE